MKLIEADQNRFLTIPGLPGPTRRPVDIDSSTTGFCNLRSLRIYRFDAGSEINGHAEEDEVFVLVLEGSVDFTVDEGNSEEGPRTFTLTAAETSTTEASLAYLPPHAAYRLVPTTNADVAYARATPPTGLPATVFAPNKLTDVPGVTALLEETRYAQRLGLRLLRATAVDEDLTFTLLSGLETDCEALVHVAKAVGAEAVRIIDNNGKAMELKSWNTAAVYPGTSPKIQLAANSSALIVVVTAR